MKLQAITNDTLRILDAGGYDRDGHRVEIGAAVERACARTRAHSPAEVAATVQRVAATQGTSRGEVVVTAESTTACARRLVAEGARVACLNFASAKNPGGGFLGSARAQEEQVCRASALYPTLRTQRVYYDENRAGSDARYTDWAITSPDVPVFRDDAMKLLPSPFEASFVTMPA
ncbi:MAG: TIGR02452 family protein, partial [Polyangiaceae bacterium]|nr:TIGR02452 family protein [Polyangiaceae bacterium]